ncbi:MAG: hypothetical protein M0Q22_08500 [Sulfuritalea sp.]|nr:hypothetical protein [Sulfuritalea sp.]
MRIDSASYSLTSSHLATTRDESSESLRAWIGNRRPDFEAGGNAAASAVSLSSAARASLAADLRAAMASLSAPPVVQPTQAPEVTAIEEASDAVENDPILRLIRSMIEMLTGQSIRTFSAKELQHAEAAPAMTDPKAAAPAAPQQTAPARPAGFGIEYDYHAVHQESEQTQVSAEGSIRTSDGREISFKLDLSMTRSYREETSVSLRAGDAVRRDPLVLNFDGTAAQLSDQRFAFDLDSDGTTDNLALLAGGSGYLAIDRNANGRIDSGSELFGPATNSGFDELAALDNDHNGWIDENDTAFTALRIWTPDATGDGTLETLAQRNVGAIATGSVASPFELRGAGNSNLGAIAASGVFLAEDGRTGWVQEIDLTV